MNPNKLLLASCLAALMAPAMVFGQATGTPRNYATPYTFTPPTIDGVANPGEWDAAPEAGGWGILRRLEGEVDSENTRFRMMWDENFLYILVQSAKTSWSDANDAMSVPHVPGVQVQGISFGADNLNIYIDPNTDGEVNERPDNQVDGYQMAWNQLTGRGELIDDGAGGRVFSNTGLFLECHVNTPFGNQGRWQGLRKSTFIQNHGATGGTIEFALAWADLDAPDRAQFLADSRQFPGEEGTYHPARPRIGDKWIFNISRISSDSENFLPVWSWHSAQSFAVAPHGLIEFTGGPRSYTANYTRTPPTVDGVISQGEWDDIPFAGDWNILRRPAGDVDSEKTRFKVTWDSTNLYFLVVSDKTSWSPGNGLVAEPHVPGVQIQGISFGADNLNLYLDPNLDKEPTLRPDGEVDGYQIAWNQFEGQGELVDDLNGGRVFSNTGFFLENHIQTPFGNNGRWQGLRQSTLVQNHGANGGVIEFALAWADLDAPSPAQWEADIELFPADTGTALRKHPMHGDEWIFNMGRISSDPDNFLPVWSWHGAQSFAVAPHGFLKFAGGPRTYTAQFTPTPPTIDGQIEAGEWNFGGPGGGQWGILRRPSADVDAENTRFRAMWDNTYLYLLVQSDKMFWSDATGNVSEFVPGVQIQGISFGADNLNIYIDPNLDGEPNSRPDSEVDGYQIAWNQYTGEGSLLETATGGREFTNTGLFLENHINTPFGNQGLWQGLRKSMFRQVHGAEGGIIEFALAWEDLDSPSEAQFPDGLPEDSGTAHPMAPANGDSWIFNISRISSDPDNFLPVWSWHGAQGFAVAPHGDLIFAGAPTSGGLPINNVVARLEGGNVLITISGGTAPFQLQKRATLTGTWANEGAPFDTQTVTVPAPGAEGYFRVIGQ